MSDGSGVPVGPPETWDMDQRARVARHRHHAVKLRALAKASGQTPDDYLAGIAVTEPEAAEQGAALLAYDDHLRARDEAARAARRGSAEDWQRRAQTAEGELKEARRIIEGKDALIDRMVRQRQAEARAHAAALRVARKGSM